MGQITVQQAYDAVLCYAESMWHAYERSELCSTIGISEGFIPSIRCIYVTRCLEGSVEGAALGSITDHWWIVDKEGRRPAIEITLDSEGPDDFYEAPVIKFFWQDTEILVGERWGPGLLFRRVGTLLRKGQEGYVLADLHKVFP